METADYGQTDWQAIYNSDIEKLNDWFAKFDPLWNPQAADDNKLLSYDHSSGEWEVTSFTEAEVQDAVDKKHSQNTDQYLDQGGPNEVSAADAKDAVNKKHDRLHDICSSSDHGRMDKGSAQTTDATETTLWSKTLDDNKAYLLEVRIAARQTDNTNRAAYIRRALIYRAGGGATIQGSVSDELTIESDSNWNATIDVSGNDVRVRVTGAAGTTIDWQCDVWWQEV